MEKDWSAEELLQMALLGCNKPELITVLNHLMLLQMNVWSEEVF